MTSHVTIDQLNKCLQNNESYLQTIIGKNNRLLIFKYSHNNTWEIKVLDKNKDHIVAAYDHLYIYDTYNMIKELCVNL